MRIEFSERGKRQIVTQSLISLIVTCGFGALVVQGIISHEPVYSIILYAALGTVTAALSKPGIDQFLQVAKRGPAIYIEKDEFVVFGGYGKRNFHPKLVSSISRDGNMIVLRLLDGRILKFPQLYYNMKVDEIVMHMNKYLRY